MTHQEINKLAEQFPADGTSRPELVETHISYLILTKDYAYKIKKPVKLSFLDFSSLEKRKHYCEQEVLLNRRLTDIYLGVEPVCRQNGRFFIGCETHVIDYAVKMKRLPSGREMDNLLNENKIEARTILSLARQIANFHSHAKIITRPFDKEALMADFADLQGEQEILATHIDPSIKQQIKDWTSLAKTTLELTKQRFSERVSAGFVKDGHGDLHSGNIFILDEPVIFDCIEFSDHFRENDVLSEVAFLAMDLEFHGYGKWKDLLMEKYHQYYPCFREPLDVVIFQYFLLYRANVRLKVTALALEGQLEEGVNTEGTFKKIKGFISLCEKYANELSTMLKSTKVTLS